MSCGRVFISLIESSAVNKKRYQFHKRPVIVSGLKTELTSPSAPSSVFGLCSSTDGEPAPDRSGSLGEVVRPGVQHQRGGGRHRRGRLPPPGGLRGALRRPEAPPGAALLRILLSAALFLLVRPALVEQRHHEPFQGVDFLSLLQYMMILFMVFVLQFSISCACLALNTDQQVRLFPAVFTMKHRAAFT